MFLKKQITTIIVILISCIPIVSASQDLQNDTIIKNDELPDSHFIEGVPYFGQPTEFYCHFASLTMILKYFKINTSFQEILFHSGVGYSTSYLSKTFVSYPSVFTSQEYEDVKFLSDLYGMSLDYWRPENESSILKMNKEQCWDIYWPKIKKYISENIPVLVVVNPLGVPYYKKLYNITTDKITSEAAHDIVIIGYNDTRQKIFYNDPGTVLYTCAEDGTHANMSYEDLKKSANAASYPLISSQRFLMEAFTNVTDPLPKNEAFNLSHSRNIERLKGNKSAYDNGIKQYFDCFGVKALKELKNDFKLGKILFKIPFLKLANKLLKLPYEIMFTTVLHNYTLYEKIDIAQYLLENENLSVYCKHDAGLMLQEILKYKEFYDSLVELTNVLKHKFIRSFIESIPIILDINEKLEELIFIEESIISGPIDDF
jgi:hypothetical protein